MTCTGSMLTGGSNEVSRANVDDQVFSGAASYGPADESQLPQGVGARIAVPGASRLELVRVVSYRNPSSPRHG